MFHFTLTSNLAWRHCTENLHLEHAEHWVLRGSNSPRSGLELMGPYRLYSICTGLGVRLIYASVYKEKNHFHTEKCFYHSTKGMKKAPQLRVIRLLLKSYTTFCLSYYLRPNSLACENRTAVYSSHLHRHTSYTLLKHLKT